MEDNDVGIESSEVFMVEDVPGSMDTKAAKEIAARGGYVHHEEGKFKAFLPIGRAYDWFRKLFERASEQNPPPA